MYRKSLSHLLIAFAGIALIGCNRGCTTEHTIKSESRMVSTKGGNAEIIGRVVDYRHSKRIDDNIFERTVSHTFGLTFDIKFGTFQQLSFYDEGVADPEAVNLTEELKRVEVAISDDQNHIGLGVDGKVVDVIHLYKSHRIYTENQALNAATSEPMDWSKLDINSYPSPEEILTESLKKSCDGMSGTEAIYQFCNDSKPSSKIHQIMLKKWPDCSAAKNYLTSEKVRELSKSDKWRKYAEKRGKKVLGNLDKYNYEMDEIRMFIEALGSKELQRSYDEELMKKWGIKGGTDVTKQLIERIKDQKTPMSNDLRASIRNEASSEFSKFQITGESNSKREANYCLQVLNALGDTTAAYNFVQNSFGSNVKKFDEYDFLGVAYDDFDVFTAHQQRQILNKTEETFKHFQDYSRSSYYSAIEDLVDCSLLKRLKTAYPEDLKMSNVPFRCEK